MKYIQNYDSYLNENINYELLLEKKSEVKFFKSVQDDVVKKLNIDLYFANAFTWGIGMLYPLINALANNSGIPDITPYQIVCLTLFSITQILNLANNDAKKLKDELIKDDLLHLVEKVKNSLLSIQKIFSFVSRSFGKIISSFIDMIGYVGLLASVVNVLPEIFSEEGLNLDTLPQKIMVLGGALSVYTIKSMADSIIDRIKK